VIDRQALIDVSVGVGERPNGPVDGLIERRDVTISCPTRLDIFTVHSCCPR
jgi:hypothetical protein